MNTNPLLPVALLTTMVLAGCGELYHKATPASATGTASPTPPLLQKPFGKTADNDPVDQFILTNAKGSSARFISYGAILTNLFVPDKAGHLGDVVLGYDTVNQYELSIPSMCNVVGRFANRIGNATFSIHQGPTMSITYHTSANQGPNTLHGGFKGLGKRNWKGDMGMTPDGPAVRFTILDPAGAEGFPGNLTVTVIYTLTNDDILKIQFLATTDKATPVNLSQHAYFNLSGNQTGENLNYIAHFNADRYLPMNATLVPTGELAPVAGTPFDFTKPKTIGHDISPLPGKPPGYDHSFFLNRPENDTSLMKAAEIYDPASGRLFECFTTEPVIHFTNGRNLAGIKGKNSVPYSPYYGFTIETQHPSDAPNHLNFPSTMLYPGETYNQLSEYKFSIPTKPLQAE